MSHTLLKIQGAGMPPLKVDDCIQTLEGISLGGFHRTVNGELVYTGISDTIKYRSVCWGKGMGAPGVGALKRGDVVKVHCIQRLWQEASSRTILLSRPAVEGTVLVLNAQRESVAFTVNSPSELKLLRTPRAPVYVSYCPLLKFRVIEIALETVEWGDSVTWKLAMEEA